MPPQPAKCNGALDPGAELLTAAASSQKRLIDALDVDAAVLHRLDGVGQLQQLLRGVVGVGEEVARTSCRRPIFFIRAAHHDLKRIFRQWPLQRLRLTLTRHLQIADH